MKDYTGLAIENGAMIGYRDYEGFLHILPEQLNATIEAAIKKAFDEKALENEIRHLREDAQEAAKDDAI